jgi:hypothetical protein
VHGDSGYKADDDVNVGDSDRGYHGQAVRGGGAEIHVSLLLGHDEVSSVLVPQC